MTYMLGIVQGLLVLVFLFAGALGLVPHSGSPQHSSRQEAGDHSERHDESAVRGCCVDLSE